jgi:hypothetical protein
MGVAKLSAEDARGGRGMENKGRRDTGWQDKVHAECLGRERIH